MAKSLPGADVAAEHTGSISAARASAQDAAPQPPPVAQSAPEPAAIAISPELLEKIEAFTRDLAVVRQSVEQLTAKQDQMAREIAILQAAEQNIGQKLSFLQQPLSQAVPLPPRKHAPRLTARKPAAQSSSVPQPTPFPLSSLQEH
jgi:hypothetical protein